MAQRHVANESAQQPECLHRIVEQLIEKQAPKASGTFLIYDCSGNATWINFGALEVFVPIGLVVHQLAVEVFLPERRAAIDAQPIEGEGIQRKLCRKIERGANVFNGFIRDTDHEEPMHDLNA